MDGPVIDMPIPLWERLYMPAAMLMMMFGVIAMFSIGLPFAILGLGMMVLWPLRRRQAIFVSLLVGLFVFVFVAVLIAPGACTAVTDDLEGGARGTTTCENPLGIKYEGATGYDAPLWPAALAGTTAGLIVSSGTYLFFRRSRSAKTARPVS